MRTFTTCLLLSILLLSITLVIFKPQPKIQTKIDSEPTRAEVLIKGSNQQMPQKENKHTRIVKVKKVIEYIPQPNIIENKNQEISQTQPTTQPTTTKPELSNIDNSIQNIKIDPKIKTLQKDLSEKYNNNPNAEVSEEDLQNYMQKLINQ